MTHLHCKIVAVVWLVGAAFVLFNPSIVSAQSRPPHRVPALPPLGHTDWKPVPQEVNAAYWTLEPGWNTEIEMRNNVVFHDLTVTPVLRLATGQELPLKAITIPPQHVISVDLRGPDQVDPGILDHIGSFGSVAFRFDGFDAANLFAAAIVKHEGQPITFHFDADDSGPKYPSSGIEGMWWIPAQSSTDYLILSNPATKAVEGSLLLSSTASNRRLPLNIGPGGTTRIDIRQLLGPSANGAIGSLTVSLPRKESLSATQIVFDEVTGFTAIMKLFQRDPEEKVQDHTLFAPMMALSHPDPSLGFRDETTLNPRVFLRNAASTNMNVSLNIRWRSQTKSGDFVIPAFSLPSGSVKVISLKDYQRDGEIDPEANWAVLQLGYNGRTADLVAVAVSYDATYRYGLQTPFSETLAHIWAGGMWHVDATHNTFITTGNGGPDPTVAEVTLFYNGGKDKYLMRKSLSPGQPLWIDVGKLIHDQAPDIDGRTISPDVMTGSYEIRDLDHATVGQLYEGKLVLDKTYGHASYGCGNCCGQLPATLNPDPFGGPIDTNSDDIVDSVEQCSGFVDNITSAAYNWQSSNTAIATLPSPTLHTVGPGSTSGSTEVYLQGTHPAPQCPNYYDGPGQPITVCPSSFSINKVTPEPLANVFPKYETGLGAMAAILVAPTTSNWNATTVYESLSTKSNSCPSAMGNLCTGSSSFTVGSGPYTAVDGTVFYPEQTVFYDEHVLYQTFSELDANHITSCQAVCQQTYSCVLRSMGTDTITYSLTKGIINGTSVTLVNATIQ